MSGSIDSDRSSVGISSVEKSCSLFPIEFDIFRVEMSSIEFVDELRSWLAIAGLICSIGFDVSESFALETSSSIFSPVFINEVLFWLSIAGFLASIFGEEAFESSGVKTKGFEVSTGFDVSESFALDIKDSIFSPGFIDEEVVWLSS